MIKLFSNSTQINVVAETLTLTEKNNAFSDSFSLQFSQYPFLILEDKNTIASFGSKHILSLEKQKEYEVTVVKDNQVFYGKLKIKSYVIGARKCDLVFGTELLKILAQPLSEFMPIVYYNGSIPYSEQSLIKLEQTNLVADLKLDEAKEYPYIDVLFPEIKAENYYDLEGKWAAYQDYFNKRDADGKLVINTINEIETDNFTFTNANSYKPFVFLLSILKYALANIGFSIKGDFTEDDFVKKLLIASQNFQNTLYKKEFTGVNYTFRVPTIWTYWYYNGQLLPFDPKITFFIPNTDVLTETMAITFVFNNIPIPLNGGNVVISITNAFGGGESIRKTTEDAVDGFINIKETLSLSSLQRTTEAHTRIYYSHPDKQMPESYTITLHEDVPEVTLNQLHPTINLANHVPKWTVGECINNCKNLFNLKIDIYDNLKQLSLNYVDTYLTSKDIVDLSNYNFTVEDYTNNETDNFKIAYASGELACITKTTITSEEPIDADVIEIENSFVKSVFNGMHNEVTENDFSNGEIIVVNELGLKTSNSTPLKSLDLVGLNGIANKNWKNWVKFRQTASAITLVGKVSKLDKMKISEKQKVYYQNIVFLVEKMKIKEKDGFTEITLEVQSLSI